MEVSMLDMNNPMSEHIRTASNLIDAVMARGHEMTVSPSSVRMKLLAECLPLFREMRELNAKHFDQSSYIAQTIDEYERAIRTVAELGNGELMEDRRDGEGNCPYCGTPITKYKALPDDPTLDFYMIYCAPCTNFYLPAKVKLESLKGFGAEMI
jgi:hypothetical protein